MNELIGGELEKPPSEIDKNIHTPRMGNDSTGMRERNIRYQGSPYMGRCWISRGTPYVFYSRNFNSSNSRSVD
jgi:hypothetical protein